jgi:hypothetical protein
MGLNTQIIEAESKQRFYPSVDINLRPMKVGLLARTSSEKQEHEQSIDIQLDACERYFIRELAQKGATLVDRFVDPSYSLEFKDPNAGVWRLMRAIVAGEINTILTFDLNRLLRSKDKVLVEEIRRTLQDFKVITVGPMAGYKVWENKDDLPNSITSLLPAHDKTERCNTLAIKRSDNAETGKRYRSAAPGFGYRLVVNPSKLAKATPERYKYVVDEIEAKVVKDIYLLFAGRDPEFLSIPPELRFARRTLSTIKQILVHNEVIHGPLRAGYVEHVTQLWQEGFKQRRPQMKWRTTSLSYILANRKYTGELVVVFDMDNHFAGSQLEDLNIRPNRRKKFTVSEHDGRQVRRYLKSEDVPLKVISIPVPAIIDEELFLEVQSRRKKLKSKSKAKSGGDYWYSNVAVCSVCNGPLKLFVKKPSGSEATTYLRCKSGHQSLLFDEAVDAAISSITSSLTSTYLGGLLKALDKQKKLAPKNQPNVSDIKVARIEKDIADLQAELLRYREDYKNRELSAKSYELFSTETEQKIAAKNAELEKAKNGMQEKDNSADLRKRVATIEMLKSDLESGHLKAILGNPGTRNQTLFKKQFMEIISKYIKEIKFSTQNLTDEVVLRTYLNDSNAIQNMIQSRILSLPKLSEITGVSIHKLRQKFWSEHKGKLKQYSQLIAEIVFIFEQNDAN